MATKQLLIKSLQRPYDRILFAKEVLNPVFGSGFTLYNEPILSHEQPNQTELQVIQQPVYKYGEIVLEDGTEVNCFEITLQPKVRIEQSRVAIQHFVRKLLTAGQSALVNFISPTTNNIWRLTLVAKDSEITEDGIREKTTHSKRYTYLVEKDRPNRTLAERLESLSLETVIGFEALVKAFSVEIMSKAFFDEYKHHYQNFVEYLTGKRTVKERSKWVEKQVSKASPYLVSIFNGNEKDARNFNKKLLGRIVFLYFVQKKRWLGASSTEYTDGYYDFIYQLFEDTGGDERFFPHGLTGLFFNVLNKERPNDDYTTPTGQTVKIPYLNGGLFNRDEVDEILHKKGDLMTFPPHLFSNPDLKDVPYERGFLDFLNAYNFTVYEDSPNDHTVAVDPEMLGHIFENLLEDNKDKGAYYTPKEIVSYMCRESLTEYLVTHLSKEYKVYREIGNDQVELFGNEVKTGQLSMIEELGDKALNRKDVEQIVKEKSIDGLTDKQLKKINQLLDGVKICDPAIGSGAFPMGLLQEIFTVKEMIAHELHRDWKPDEVKEHIIQNSIYGVDIEKGAVDIARLRFWLSLIVDIEKPKALPNLDYKIVVGDSLVSKVKIDGTEEIVEINWDLKSSVGEADKYVKNIQSLLKEVVEKQTIFFNPNAKNKNKLKQEIRDLKIELLINQLKFEKEKFQSKTASTQDIFDTRKTKVQLDRELRISGFNKLVGKLEKLLKQPDKPFDHFDWKLDFPEIQNPFIQKDNIGFDIVIGNPPWVDSETMVKNSDEYRQIVKNKYSTTVGNWDIFVPFIEKGNSLLKSDSGTFSYIIPNKLISAKYTESLRNHLLSFSILEIRDYSRVNVFKEAFVYPITVVLTKAYAHKTVQMTVMNDTERIKYTNEISNKTFAKDVYWDKYFFSKTIVNLLLKISESEKIGDLEVDITGAATVSEAYLIKEILIDSVKYEKTKKLINTGTIDKYSSLWGIRDTQYIKDRYVNPRVKDEDLKRLNQNRLKQASKPKIILAGMSSEIEAFYDSKGTYLAAKSTIIILGKVEELIYLTALLNSQTLTFFINHTFHSLKMSGGYLNISPTLIKQLPLPKNNSTIDKSPIITLVTYLEFLINDISNDNKDKLLAAYYQQIIDGIVYELYFPDLLKKHNREILRHLGELPEFTKGMLDDEKMKICKDVFNRLNDKSHPVRNNLFYMNSIPEIRLIEGKNENH